MPSASAQVAIVMGSDSDLPTLIAAVEILEQFGIPYQTHILSAHRTPQAMVNYAQVAHTQGIQVIIAGAGGAAHLPGMVAALTPLPVIGVPIPTRYLQGVDSLYSIVQMPRGIPVATVAIGNAHNAGLLAVQILATQNPALQSQVLAYRDTIKQQVEDKDVRLQDLGPQAYLAAQS